MQPWGGRRLLETRVRHSSNLAGIFSLVCEDADDEDSYVGEQKEIAKEMDQFLVVQYVIN